MEFDFEMDVLKTPQIDTNMEREEKSCPTPDLFHTNNSDMANNKSNTYGLITTAANDESLSSDSTKVNLIKIENELKQTMNQLRKPTASPFRKIVESGVFKIDKVPASLNINNDITDKVPSTAELVADIESLETLPIGTVNDSAMTCTQMQDKTMNISLKKQLLKRSQSNAEPASSTLTLNNTSPQIIDRNIFHADSNINQYQSLTDMPLNSLKIEPDAQTTNNIQSQHTIRQKTNRNDKRPLQQNVQGPIIPSTNTTSAPIHSNNEVTSSYQTVPTKRQRQTFVIKFEDNPDVGLDDQRKKQIRDSNREAARRCRERRRHYIEKLEGDIERYKSDVNKLTEKLTRIEQENTRLRAIITEAKLLNPMTFISTNDISPDFHLLTGIPNGNDFNLETTDGNSISRGFITRNNH